MKGTYSVGNSYRLPSVDLRMAQLCFGFMALPTATVLYMMVAGVFWSIDMVPALLFWTAYLGLAVMGVWNLMRWLRTDGRKGEVYRLTLNQAGHQEVHLQYRDGSTRIHEQHEVLT